LHGLRTTAAKNLADLGADVRAIQAMLGHRTPIMSFHYSRGAEQKRAARAAVVTLENRGKPLDRFSKKGV
jgi:integrase